MPTPAELVGSLVSFVSDVLGASSLRFEIGPTLVVLGILLAFLQLVARPVSRWVTGDAGGLLAVGRAMALAAESGTDAVVSLGTAGIEGSPGLPTPGQETGASRATPALTVWAPR